MQKIKVYSSSSESDFEAYVNGCLKDGWKISSTSCGFVDSENYNFCNNYQIILFKDADCTKGALNIDVEPCANCGGEEE